MRIAYRRLPARKQDLRRDLFPGERCVYAERDRDDGCREYEVKLANGTDIDFHASGDWKKVSCEYSFLPAGIVPQAIVDDLAVRFPEARISKAARASGRLRDYDRQRAGADLLGRRDVHTGRDVLIARRPKNRTL